MCSSRPRLSKIWGARLFSAMLPCCIVSKLGASISWLLFRVLSHVVVEDFLQAGCIKQAEGWLVTLLPGPDLGTWGILWLSPEGIQQTPFHVRVYVSFQPKASDVGWDEAEVSVVEALFRSFLSPVSRFGLRYWASRSFQFTHPVRPTSTPSIVWSPAALPGPTWEPKLDSLEKDTLL